MQQKDQTHTSPEHDFYKENQSEDTRKRKRTVVNIVFVLALFLLGGFVSLYGIFFASPSRDFSNAYVSIHEGATLSEVSGQLKEEGIIKNSTAFKTYVKLVFEDTSVHSGDYFFSTSENMFGIAQRITSGEYGLEQVRVTIPEGVSIYEIASLLKEKLPLFDEQKFVELAKDKEGYLFPETYFFLPNITPEHVIDQMTETFHKKIVLIEDEISSSEKSLHEIVVMASLLEKEAHTIESRKTIAGILWNRIEIGMPLQVDAAFLYINGKSTYDLTQEDLASDSLYNTYKYKGLPVGPITNPGLDSLVAAAAPVENKYVYYLSDREGNLYYSETFEEHKRYKNLYVY